MDKDRRIIMFARQGKGQFAVTDQGQLLPLRVVYCVNLVQPLGLIAHFAGQIIYQHSFDIDCPIRRRLVWCHIFHEISFS